MQPFRTVMSLIFFAVAAIGEFQTLSGEEVSFQSGTNRFKGHLATPNGPGPFPAVLFLHGGKGPIVAGDPEGTVETLAKAGFVGFAPIRRNGLALAGNVQNLIAAIDHVKSMKNVNAERLAIIGFSRGGLLAYMSSTRRRDLKAVVLMAPAHGRGALRRFLTRSGDVTASTLILVAQNDTKQADHVSICRQINATLKDAEKDTRLIVYPAYERDGHRLFFEVRKSYWQDVQKFLKSHLDE